MVEHSRNAALGFAVFFVLALGMGLPYVVLALAAGSIRNLPRSGQWLAWVEHLFGFVLVGLALYFFDPLIPQRLATRLLPYYAVGVGIYLGFISPYGRNLRAFQILRLAVGTASLIALAYFAIPTGRSTPLSFMPFSRVKLDAAAAQHKPVLIDFAADWCIPCREMELTTFVNPAVVGEARRFVALRADLTREDQGNDSIVNEFQILGVPTMLVLNSRGEVRARMIGYVGPKEFLDSLRTVN